MEAGRPNGGLLRALGDDNGLIGVPRRGKGTASPRGSASHISVSSGDSDDGGDSRYASLGALGSKPSHSAPRQKEEKRDGRGAGPARLDEYPSFPRGRVEKSGVENADGQTGQGSRFVFTNPVRDPKSPKKAAGAVKPVQAILIDSDDEKSLPATNSKSGRPPKGAKSPAKGAGNRAIRAEDYISLADSSDGSDSDDQVAGTTVPDEARAAGSTKATPRVVERLATQPGSAPPGPGRQKIPLPAKPGSVSNPPGLPGRPASAMSNRSLESAVSVAGKASKPTPEEIEEQRKANKRARKKAARARKSEARAAAAGATTPPAAAEPADSEAGTKAEIAQPEPAAPAKPHFSFRMTGKKTEVADLSKPLFRTPSSAKDPVANKPTGPLAEDSDSEMDIESDSGSGVDLAELREQSTDASQTPDTYTNLESMRTRKKARLSTAEEDFISFAGVISEDEEEDKPKKERWKPPPMNQRDEERRRMFGDPNVAQSPLLNLPQPPWIPDGKIYLHPGGHPAAMLNQEVLDFIEYIAPRPEEHAMRQIVVERVSSAVRSVWPNARVEVFGSFDTRMYLPSSDIDLVVFEPTARPPSCLEPLARAMKNLGLVHSLEVISTARVPIIKSVDSLTLYRLDISFNMASGLESAQIVKKMLDSRVGGALKALMLVLKQFLLQRNMNEVFSGGVGSYGLMIMIANFLMVRLTGSGDTILSNAIF